MPPRRKLLAYTLGLYRVIKDNDYKIVHIHKSSATLAIEAFVAKCAGTSVIIGHSHNSAGRVKAANYFLRPFANMFTTLQFACSQEAGRWAFGDRAEVYVINNAIDTNKFSFDESVREKYRRDLGLADCYVVGTVAKLHPPKNIGRLLEIFKRIADVNDGARLLIVGDGPDEDILIQKSADLGLQGKAIFLGRRTDVANLMCAMDVFVLPSLFEGLGMVCIEAQATGLRVVSSDNVPKVDILGDETTLSLESDNEHWKDEILRKGKFNREKSTKEYLRKAGYDIETEALKLEEIYLKSLESNDNR